MKTKTYSFFDAKKKSVDFQEICKSLKAASTGSIVVLPSSAYNPAGVEPSGDQWRAIAKMFKEKGLFVLFDSVGQGLVSGDIKKDNLSIQTFLEEEVQVVVCQSLSSSLGIYGEKVGFLHVVCGSKEVAGKVLEQLKYFIRFSFSLCVDL